MPDSRLVRRASYGRLGHQCFDHAHLFRGDFFICPVLSHFFNHKVFSPCKASCAAADTLTRTICGFWPCAENPALRPRLGEGAESSSNRVMRCVLHLQPYCFFVGTMGTWEQAFVNNCL